MTYLIAIYFYIYIYILLSIVILINRAIDVCVDPSWRLHIRIDFSLWLIIITQELARKDVMIDSVFICTHKNDLQNHFNDSNNILWKWTISIQFDASTISIKIMKCNYSGTPQWHISEEIAEQPLNIPLHSQGWMVFLIREK